MASAPATQRDRLRNLLVQHPVARAQELRNEGIAAATIARAVKDGEIERIGRGLYQRPEAPIDVAHALAETAKRIPKGVIAMISALAFGINNPVILIFAGIVYVLETLSDILQIAHYKRTHRRIFKMAPIHHHFEMCGWSEWKIVIVFSIVQLLGAAVSVLAIKAL